MREYPYTYEEFKKYILNIFLNEESYLLTKENKQGFINNNFDFHEIYENECRYYDNGATNVFENPELASDYTLGLMEDCHGYCEENNLLPKKREIR